MTRAHRSLLAVHCLAALLALAALFAAPAALAQGQSLFWRRYDTDITVLPTGDMLVVETQEIEFTAGSFSQGFAVIPREKTDSIVDFGVREGDRVYTQTARDTGEPYTFFVSQLATEIEIVWNFPSTGPGAHTYELSYTVRGAIRQYPEAAELQWKAVSSERDFAAESSTVTVHLPSEGFPIEGRIVAFSPAQIEWNVPDATTVVFRPTRALRAGEGIEVGVAFNPDAITGPKPAWQQRFDEAEARRSVNGIISGLLTVAALVAVPLGLYLLWYLFGRDPAIGAIPEYVTEPPSDLPPGVIGTLIDERADTPDVVATVVDLARKGALTIEEEVTQGQFGNVTRKFILRKAERPEHLAKYEATLLDGLFKTQDSRRLDSLAGSLFATFERIRRELYDEVVKRGLFKANPDSIRGRYRALGIVGIVLAAVAFFCTVATLGADASFYTCLPMVFGLGAIALIVLAGYMPAKTRKGAEEAARWRAFKKFLENIDKYKDLKEATDLFEKYLPYATAFGLDRKWVTAFAQVEATPVPRWYVPLYGPGGVPRRVSGIPGAAKVNAAPAPPAAAGGPAAAGLPSLAEAGANIGGGLQSFSDGMVTMLNTTARTLNIQPAATSSGGSGRRYTSSGSRGFSGGSFRSSGGGFRSGGGGGGGGRGFR